MPVELPLSLIVRGLPVLVEAEDQGQPVAYWWQGQRHAVDDIVCLWDDRCYCTVHWLVQSTDGRRVTLVYDRAANQWIIEPLGA